MIYLIIYIFSIGIYTYLPNRINYYFCSLLTLFLIMDIIFVLLARFLVRIKIDNNDSIGYAPYQESFTVHVLSSWLPLGYLKGKLHSENTFYELYEDFIFQSELFEKQQDIKVDFSFDYSGIYQFTLTDVVVYDLLGLLHFKIKSDLAFEKVLFPTKKDNYQLAPITGIENKNHKLKQRTDSYQDDFEFNEYRDGMSLSKIHRKLSFKFDKPIVIQYNGYLNENANVYLKINEQKDICENILRIYSAFAHDLLNENIAFVLHINNQTKYSIQNESQWQYATRQIYKSAKTGPAICYTYHADLILQENENEIYKVESL